jgi:predicted nucleic acid-binding protein
VSRIVVNDASCLIDLKKGRLLHAMLSLPFQFVIPLPVRASELLDFTAQEWQMLDDSGVQTYDLEPDAVADAMEVKARHPALSANDCFCLVTSQRQAHCVLLTGDAQLRRAAEQRQIEVHGILWIVDQLAERELAPPALLVAALESWRDDRSVFLPITEIQARLRHLG